MCRCMQRAYIHTYTYVYCILVYSVFVFDMIRLYERYIVRARRIIEARQSEAKWAEGTRFIGSFERVSCPRAAYRPQPVRVKRKRSCRRGIIGRRRRRRRRVVIEPRERASHTAVEAGRPAGRRLISVAGGLADVCVWDRDVASPPPRLPESLFSAGNAGTRSAAPALSRIFSALSTLLRVHAQQAWRARLLALGADVSFLSRACDISSITARSIRTSAFHSYVM